MSLFFFFFFFGVEILRIWILGFFCSWNCDGFQALIKIFWSSDFFFWDWFIFSELGSTLLIVAVFSVALTLKNLEFLVMAMMFDRWIHIGFCMFVIFAWWVFNISVVGMVFRKHFMGILVFFLFKEHCHNFHMILWIFVSECDFHW